MLRFLGVVFLVFVSVSTAPWGLLAGGLLWVGWYFARPERRSQTYRLPFFHKSRSGFDGNSLSAIPLLQAVYCANCDLITNSPREACGVCGSHSGIAVSRLWQLTSVEARTNAACYHVSFTADVRGIPVSGLRESTRFINRLAELGRDVKVLHIQVDPISNADSISGEPVELRKPVQRSGNAWQQVRRRAS